MTAMTANIPPPTDPQNADLVESAVADVEYQFRMMFLKVRTAMRDRALSVHPDLQPVGYKVLSTIVHSGPVHAGTLAETLMADKSLISRTVKQLELLGFVQRSADPEDGRAFYLTATAVAREKIHAIQQAQHDVLFARLSSWQVEDVERLGVLLAKLNEAMTGESAEVRRTPA